MESESGSRRDWVTIAALTRTWGRRGELAAIPLSSRLERFESLREVYVFRRNAGQPERLELESFWEHRGRLIVKFKGIDSISDALPYEGGELSVRLEERFELPEGEYYQSDLVGCEILDRHTGVRIGQVVRFSEAGGSGLLEVQAEEKGEELLIPFARRICIEIDVGAKRIVVDLPEGLRELNRS